jgi:hypothetical protein
MPVQQIAAVYSLASVAEHAQGRRWYRSAYMIADQLATAYGVTTATAAGIIAALSPRNKWERNVVDAENILKVNQLDPDSLESVKVCTFGANKAKAIRILRDNAVTTDAVLTILSGPKLQEFFSCIMGIDSEVCIDGHAYSIWAGDRITLDSIPSIGKKLRAEIKKDYREAAAQAGIEPHEMQAVTWCAWRRLHGV